MMWEPEAMAAQGMVAPSDMLTMVHAKEMVLPAHISNAVQNMAHSSTSIGGHTYNQRANVTNNYNGGKVPDNRAQAKTMLREFRRMNLV
jgi:hypothetical protein